MDDNETKRGRGRPASPKAERPKALNPALAHPASARVPAALRRTSVEGGPGWGFCRVRTSDPAYALKALAACASGRSGWELVEVEVGEDGSEVGWDFAAPASLIMPKVRKPRPDSAARLAEANAARKAKRAPAPAYDPEDF